MSVGGRCRQRCWCSVFPTRTLLLAPCLRHLFRAASCSPVFFLAHLQVMMASKCHNCPRKPASYALAARRGHLEEQMKSIQKKMSNDSLSLFGDFTQACPGLYLVSCLGLCSMLSPCLQACASDKLLLLFFFFLLSDVSYARVSLQVATSFFWRG